ncbi:MAG: hypothetical protein M1826_003017 [Phylliscum demangeonii]|nr:MAG: hypothetical protein M1826_003017 [Phylliscum demangeonii]
MSSAPLDESPSTHTHSSSYPATTPQLTSSATSPSTVAMSTQVSQQAGHVPVALHPFAALHEPKWADGGKADEDGDGDVRMMMNLDDMIPADASDPMLVPLPKTTDAAEPEHARTDHDRHAPHEPADGGKEMESRLEADHGRPTVTMTSASRPSHPAASPTILHATIMERLQADVGPLHLLCRAPHHRLRPHPTQDLLTLYGLQPLAASVARTDPVTGEKRKMRKTYKGKIIAFGLAGRNQEVRHADGQPGGLVEMMRWPDEEWCAQKVAGKEVQKGLSDRSLAQLEQAMRMAKGPMPAFDPAVLGLEALGAETITGMVTSSAVPETAAAAAAAADTRPATKPPLTVDTAAAGSDLARPRRSGKKRRYDEHSFEGYGEGFVDDHDDEDGDSVDLVRTGAERDEPRAGSGSGSAAKKRKRAHDPYRGGGGGAGGGGGGGGGAGGGAVGVAGSPGLMERGSYGVGMVGIGSSVGADPPTADTTRISHYEALPLPLPLPRTRTRTRTVSSTPPPVQAVTVSEMPCGRCLQRWLRAHWNLQAANALLAREQALAASALERWTSVWTEWERATERLAEEEVRVAAGLDRLLRELLLRKTTGWMRGAEEG